MAKNLVIVESPAKAKTIKKYLGKNYSVVASMGHLRDLPKSQLGIDIDNNFEPKYITIRGKGDLVAKLKKEAKSSTKIYLATDPDREGEAISWHLSQLMDIDEKDNCRITFNEITKTAVKAAIKNPRCIDLDLVDAQQARRAVDRIVGYKISPLLWKKVKKGLSAGRVQSVATKIICDREEEINAFESKEFWTIEAQLKSPDDKKKFKAKYYGDEKGKKEIKTESSAKKIVESIKNADFVVNEVKKSQKKRVPSPPFTTSTLQQEASRKLGFTVKRTMQAAQQLYEGIDIKGYGTIGLITYMRTDSLRISEEARMEVSTFIGQKFGNEYRPKTPRIYKAKKTAQDAHEAIRPTSVSIEPLNIKESLTGDQFKLYKLIWERFVAAHMENAILNVVNVTISVNNQIFKASGSSIEFGGYMNVYIEGKDAEDNSDQQSLPELKENMVLELKKLGEEQHFTQPPPRYTEATLIKILEEKGIGRPSTYAPTITTILARNYVMKESKSLKPTELGTVVNEIMSKHFVDIVDIKFTAKMESRLDEIEEGKAKWDSVVKEFYDPFSEELKKAEVEIGQIEIKDEVSDVKCEKCGRMMVYKMGRFGKFLACPGFPECRNVKSIVVETGVNCPKCAGKILVKKSKRGKKYFGCENNPNCDFMTWDEPTKEICPKCGGNLYKKSGRGGKKTVCINGNCDFER